MKRFLYVLCFCCALFLVLCVGGVLYVVYSGRFITDVYPTGEIAAIDILIDAEDSIFYSNEYYKNGKVKAQGRYKKYRTTKIGTWDEYYADGTFRCSSEYTQKYTPFYDLTYPFYDDCRPLVKCMEFSNLQQVKPFSYNRIIPKLRYPFRIIADSIHPDLIELAYRYDQSNTFKLVPKVTKGEISFPFEIYVEDKDFLEIALLYPRPQDVVYTDTSTTICTRIPADFLQETDTTSVRWYFKIE